MIWFYLFIKYILWPIKWVLINEHIVSPIKWDIIIFNYKIKQYFYYPFRNYFLNTFYFQRCCSEPSNTEPYSLLWVIGTIVFLSILKKKRRSR